LADFPRKLTKQKGENKMLDADRFYQLIGRAILDPDFADALRNPSNDTLGEIGIEIDQLTPKELEDLKKALQTAMSSIDDLALAFSLPDSLPDTCS
jgi:hypothetical protein